MKKCLVLILPLHISLLAGENKHLEPPEEFQTVQMVEKEPSIMAKEPTKPKQNIWKNEYMSLDVDFWSMSVTLPLLKQ